MGFTRDGSSIDADRRGGESVSVPDDPPTDDSDSGGAGVEVPGERGPSLRRVTHERRGGRRRNARDGRSAAREIHSKRRGGGGGGGRGFG